jgi:aminoglycoside phosphotransferase (APT) family kinase protein
MQKGPLIGTGRTAEIFAWGSDRVLKLFMDWCPLHWIEREEMLSRIVYESGLPVPAVEDITEVNGRKGIIFERVEGDSMLDLMLANQNGFLRYAEILAELHTAIHSREVPSIPSLHDTIEGDIRNVKILSDEERTKALQVLSQMKDGTALCHYDYHPGNVIMSSRGPVIIDWMTARQGNPHADIARTLLILESPIAKSIFQSPKDTDSLYVSPSDWQVSLKSFIDRYLARYREIRDMSLQELKAWWLPIAAARLNENIPQEREWLLAVFKEELDCT